MRGRHEKRRYAEQPARRLRLWPDAATTLHRHQDAWAEAADAAKLARPLAADLVVVV
jgi:hypothetical protein